MKDRRLTIGYWLARITLNIIAVGVFGLLVELIGVQFSWWLYSCAFAVYVVLSFGDALIDYVWPLPAPTTKAEG